MSANESKCQHVTLFRMAGFCPFDSRAVARFCLWLTSFGSTIALPYVSGSLLPDWPNVSLWRRLAAKFDLSIA